MNLLFTRSLACLTASWLLTTAPRAQTLTIVAPDYHGAKLFETSQGSTITGMAAAPNGDLFYLEQGASSTQLFRRSLSDGYASATSLYNLGTGVFGSFVVWESGTVFFGENAVGSIFALDSNLTVDPLGTLAGNYDAAFRGGSLYLSHNPGGFSPQNKVSRFDLVADGTGGLMLGTADLILDTPDDYSGPIEFDAAGNLFYGGSGAFARPNLFRYSAAEVASAFGAGTTLSLDISHQYLANGNNAYLAFDGATSLWQSNYSAINRIDTTTPTSTPIATSSESIGHLDFKNTTLYAAVTNFSTNRSAVFAVTPVPEPGSAIVLFGALSLFAHRRFRR
jgi:hypothetical protein